LGIDFNLINGKELNMKTEYLIETTTEGTTQIIIIKTRMSMKLKI
jgi:hypothetical protein